MIRHFATAEQLYTNYQVFCIFVPFLNVRKFVHLTTENYETELVLLQGLEAVLENALHEDGENFTKYGYQMNIEIVIIGKGIYE